MPIVRRSGLVGAPVDTVWTVLRDFNSHHRWHPEIVESAIEGFLPPDQVGCVRRFTLRDGGWAREQLLALSDREHALRYCILAASLPLIGYVAELRLFPVTESDTTFALWTGRFRAPAADQADLADVLGERIYGAGIAGLRAHVRAPP